MQLLLGLAPLATIWLAELAIDPTAPVNPVEFVLQNSSATVLTVCLMMAIKWQDTRSRHEQDRKDRQFKEMKDEFKVEIALLRADLLEKNKEIKYLNEKIIEVAMARAEEEE